jgi:hypothetical protein
VESVSRKANRVTEDLKDLDYLLRIKLNRPAQWTPRSLGYAAEAILFKAEQIRIRGFEAET